MRSSRSGADLGPLPHTGLSAETLLPYDVRRALPIDGVNPLAFLLISDGGAAPPASHAARAQVDILNEYPPSLFTQRTRTVTHSPAPVRVLPQLQRSSSASQQLPGTEP